MRKMHNPPTGKIKNTHFITTQPHEILEKFEPILTTILHEHHNNYIELPNGNFAYQKDKSVLGVNKSFLKVKDSFILNLLNVVLKIK